jgi:hypothetical protein
MLMPTRREFLAVAATVGAGLMLATGHLEDLLSVSDTRQTMKGRAQALSYREKLILAARNLTPFDVTPGKMFLRRDGDGVDVCYVRLERKHQQRESLPVRGVLHFSAATLDAELERMEAKDDPKPSVKQLERYLNMGNKNDRNQDTIRGILN